MSRVLITLLCAASIAACSTPPDDPPDTGGETNGSTNASTNNGEARCDPASDPSCRLPVRLGDEQPCSFEGHAPGDIPSVTAGAPTRLGGDVGNIIAASHGEAGWIVATDDGKIFEGDVEVASRPQTQLLDVAFSSFGVAFSHLIDGTMIVEFRPGGGDWREVLRIELSSERPGGGLALNDDGMLWIGVGDGGTESRASDAGSLAGSLLRVDVSQQPYGIPEDNPFAGDPVRREEIWATGLRDPSRCAVFGTALWCTDRAETYIELNRGAARADYGWPYADGPGCRRSSCPEDQTGPIAFRLASQECALLPGPAMPSAFPDSQDAYLYAGVCNGRIFGVRSNADGVRQTRRIGVADNEIVGLGADEDAVLTMTADGAARRWTFTDDVDAFPRTLDDSGCLTPDGEFGDTLLPYEVASALWTDGAYKQRFIALPAGEAFQLSDDGEVTFPDGTAILKMFSRELSDGTMLPIETRVMRARDGAWDFYTYAWQDGAARLLDSGKDVLIEDPADSDSYEHHIPSRAACQSCHLNDKRVLGPVGIQLHTDVTIDGRDASQLDLFEAAGALEGTTSRDPLVDPFDESAPLDRRARSYLHANCAHCHRPGGWAPATLEMDLRHDTPLANTGTCEVDAEFGTVWADGDLRLDPGAPENSNLLQRILVDNIGRMPPIGTAVNDTRGAEVLRQWIASLDGCE